MTTSPYVARSPRVSAQPPLHSTANFLGVVKSRYENRVASSLPVRGGKTAKFRKLDPLDTLGIRLDEAITIIGTAPDDQAVDYLRALTEDAGKAESICIKLQRVARPPSLVDAELDLTTSFGTFINAIDEFRRRRMSLAACDVDMRRLRDLELGLESRARSAMLCEGMGC